jgi:quercetin dioxygenase-like cupin family protein
MYAISQSQLPFIGMSHEFAGTNHGVDISFFLVTGNPGQETRLHKHDYDEVVYVIEGRSKWTVGGEVREATAGDILIVHAGEAHKFVNSGDGPLRQIDIHLNRSFETIWLED